jgi:hypothetical protein
MSFRYGLNGNDLNWDSVTMFDKGCIDCKGDSEFCEGHTHKYSHRGWALYHDTNTNSVRKSGSVPFSVYSVEYLIDWFMHESTESYTIMTIFNELKDRNETPPIFAYWPISEGVVLNVYKIDNGEAIIGINNNLPKVTGVRSDSDEEYYVKFDGKKYYFNDFIRTKIDPNGMQPV